MIKKWLDTPLTENAIWIIKKLCYIPIGISLILVYGMFLMLEKTSYSYISVVTFAIFAPLSFYLISGPYELQKNESKGFRKFCLSSSILIGCLVSSFFYNIMLMM